MARKCANVFKSDFPGNKVNPELFGKPLKRLMVEISQPLRYR
jgi:hypothetical protein